MQYKYDPPFWVYCSVDAQENDLKDGSFKICRNWEMPVCIDSSASKAYA